MTEHRTGILVGSAVELLEGCRDTGGKTSNGKARGRQNNTQQIADIVMFGITVWLTEPVELGTVGRNKSVHVYDIIM